tara:strand:- start:874 stop:1584 length:711 start_codon:yes stop_codon:yes gene_type:complete
MSSSNPTDQFIKKRRRLLKSKSGIEDNNQRVRLQNFEKSMKREFGPNVEVSPDGIATRGGETVGNLTDFLKGGGKLEGTPKDQRSKLAIEKEKQEEFDKNFDFSERVDSVLGKEDTDRGPTMADFAPTPSNEPNLDEMSKVMAEPESLNEILEKSLTGTDKGNATGTGLQDQLNQTNARLDQLRILQEGGVKTGPQGMVKTDKGFASVKTAAGNKALKKQLARLRAQQLAKIRIGG